MGRVQGLSLVPVHSQMLRRMALSLFPSSALMSLR